MTKSDDQPVTVPQDACTSQTEDWSQTITNTKHLRFRDLCVREISASGITKSHLTESGAVEENLRNVAKRRYSYPVPRDLSISPDISHPAHHEPNLRL
jgi:hypothetical protein